MKVEEGVNGSLDKISKFIDDSTSTVIEGGKKVAGTIGTGIGEVGQYIRDTVAPDKKAKAEEISSKVFGKVRTGQEEIKHQGLLTETEKVQEDIKSLEKIKPLSERDLEYTGFDGIEEDTQDMQEQNRRDILAGLNEMKRRVEGKSSPSTSKSGAVKQYHETLKSWENKDEVGFKNGKFMPFESVDGTGSDPENSKYEIGYGIKIKQKWISDNRNDWPVINGVPTDIRDGISREVAENWCYELQNQAYSQAKESIPSTSWDKLSEVERSFWTDLTYNGGPGAIKANTKVKVAMGEGYSVEAMLKCLNYINASGKSWRGLLNRRISMYNAAALDLPGVPVIEEYEVKEDTVHLKFNSSFSTDKVSPSYANRLNTSNDMTLKVKKGMKVGKYQPSKGYSFR